MTNTELLERWINKSGKKKQHLAARCGLTPNGFRNCCRNLAEFKASQIEILCQELGIVNLTDRMAVFFYRGGA